MILRVTIHNYEFPTDQVFHNDALVYMINDLIKSGDRFLLGKRYFSKFFTLSKLNTVYWESKTPRSSVMLYDHYQHIAIITASYLLEGCENATSSSINAGS